MNKNYPKCLQRSLLGLSLFVAASSFARTTFVVPKVQSEAELSTVQVKRNISDETVVKHYDFSVTVPKGWSLNPLDNMIKMKSGMIATPVADLEKSETYFGVYARKTLTMPIKDRMAREKKMGRKVSIKKINGVSWLVTEYSSRTISRGKELGRYLAAFAVKGDTEYLAIAGTPDKVAKKYRPVFDRMLSSIKLK